MATGISIGKYNWMKIVDVMSEAPLTLTPLQTIREANELMLAKNIRQLPVVQRRELIGILTDRDIRSFLSREYVLDSESEEKALNTPVRELMTAEPITVSPNDSLQKALEILIDNKVGGIPVVDRSAGLLGIVTYIDLLRCFLNRIEED